jgi:hypothetical protein
MLQTLLWKARRRDADHKSNETWFTPSTGKGSGILHHNRIGRRRDASWTGWVQDVPSCVCVGLPLQRRSCGVSRGPGVADWKIALKHPKKHLDPH